MDSRHAMMTPKLTLYCCFYRYYIPPELTAIIVDIYFCQSTLTNESIRLAVKWWCSSNSVKHLRCQLKYGHICDWNTAQISDMNLLFHKKSRFNDDISEWDTGKVTTMSGMFQNATSFNQPLKTWNVQQVRDMSFMFSSASSFNQPIEEWKVESVIDMTCMFHEASSFNQPLDGWNVQNVIDMIEMFENASQFNQPLDNWDIGNISDMSGIFEGAHSFNQTLPVTWYRDKKNYPMNNMGIRKAVHIWCTHRVSALLAYGPISTWNTSGVTDMSCLFEDRHTFNEDISMWDTSHVTNMARMFRSASMFNRPLENWNVDKVNNMSNMFCYASAFNQPLETWNVQNVNNMSHMFYDAVCFNQTLEHWKFQSVTVLEDLHRSLNARHGSVRVLENTMEVKTWLWEEWRKHWTSIMIVVLSICIAVTIILWYSM